MDLCSESDASEYRSQKEKDQHHQRSVIILLIILVSIVAVVLVTWPTTAAGGAGAGAGGSGTNAVGGSGGNPDTKELLKLRSNLTNAQSDAASYKRQIAVLQSQILLLEEKVRTAETATKEIDKEAQGLSNQVAACEKKAAIAAMTAVVDAESNKVVECPPELTYVRTLMKGGAAPGGRVPVTNTSPAARLLKCWDPNFMSTTQCVRKHGVSAPMTAMILQDKPTEHISRFIIEHNAYEGTERFYQLLNEDSTGEMSFIDAGSNLGWYALAVASHPNHQKRLTIAVEAEVHNAERILVSKCMSPNEPANVAMNNFALYFNALSMVSGETVTMWANPANMGMSHMGNNTSTNGGGQLRLRSTDVPTLTLDDIIFNSNPKPKGIQLMKIDVEGSEGMAFKGAQRMLKEMPPRYIIMEVIPSYMVRSAVKPQQLFRMLKDAGYVCLSSPWGPTILDNPESFPAETLADPAGDCLFRNDKFKY